MVKADFVHLAEVAMSINSQFKPSPEEFNEILHRFIWAIRASPDGSHTLDDNEFREMALGIKQFDTEV